MSQDIFRSYQGTVYPSQCDAMGHMTVQYYVAAFDQAMWSLVYEIGWRPEPDLQSLGFADVRHVIDYHAELVAGMTFFIESVVTKCGMTSLVTLHKMYGAADRMPVASAEITSVHFDLRRRKSTPLPPHIRARFGGAA